MRLVLGGDDRGVDRDGLALQVAVLLEGRAVGVAAGGRAVVLARVTAAVVTSAGGQGQGGGEARRQGQLHPAGVAGRAHRCSSPSSRGPERTLHGHYSRATGRAGKGPAVTSW
ncbi:hypothetical protein [Ornithinimicrobium kibberense]|uniref:hypothetical protein n=1 Tax=Ornithinimicrobium kibberense TaxID=282060 RepID=UPI00360E2334